VGSSSLISLFLLKVAFRVLLYSRSMSLKNKLGHVRTWIGFGSENENKNPHHCSSTSELLASRFSVFLLHNY
jgi:hypothetical protein